MNRYAAIAIALTLCSSVVHAGDAVTPTEIKTTNPIRQALGTADGTLYLLEGDISRYSNQQNQESDKNARILIWDLAKNEESSALKDVPNGAVHMGISGTKLVVACGENGVLLVDLKSKSAKKVATPGVLPYYVSSDGAPGKALILCWGGKGTSSGRSLIEVDVESEKVVKLLANMSYVGHVAIAKNMLVVQSEFSHSPSARPDFYSLSECRKSKDATEYSNGVRLQEPAARSHQSGKSWHSSFGMWRSLNGGACFVTAEETGNIVSFSADCNRVLWETPGDLLAVNPAKPLLVALQSEKDNDRWGAKESWQLAGLHSASGKAVFKTKLEFGFKADRGGRGDMIGFAQTIVPTKDGDKLVVGVRTRDAGGTPRKGKQPRGGSSSDEKIVWLVADLPKVDLASCPVLEGDPTSVVRVTETFTFAPKVTNGEKAKFSLKKSPDGAKIDETTAKITWKPTDKQVGKHDFEVQAKIGTDELVVLGFEVKVTSADEFAAKDLEFGDLTPSQIVASEDGLSLFLLEQKKQGQPAPASRVIVWDVAKNAIEKSINVPKSPETMTVVNGKLVVTCPESQVVAIVDMKEKKIAKSVEVSIEKDKNLTPRQVFKDSPSGKVLVTCAPENNQSSFDSKTVEIDMSSGKCTPLYFPASRGAAYMAVAKDNVIWSDGSWGGLSKMSELRKAPKKDGHGTPMPQIDPEERSYQMVGARAVNNGANFAATDAQKGKTGLLAGDWKKVLWTTDGILVGTHPTKPQIVVLVNDPQRHFETDTLTFRGINSQSGRQVWQLVVKMGHMVRLDYWTFQRGGFEVRASKDQEELIFTIGRDSFDRTTSKWYRVGLPNKDGGNAVSLTNEPPTEIEVGGTYDWTPVIKGGTPTFTLKSGPDGMTVDAKTGKVSWKPDDASIGKHDVLLIAKVGADEIPIAFELRVRTGKGESKSENKEKSDRND